MAPRTRNTLFRPYPGDENLVVTFFEGEERNDAKTKELGYTVFEDVDMVKLSVPGSSDTVISRADAQCVMGPNEMVTYAERFPDDYERFKSGKGAALSGLPLKEAPFLVKSEISTLNAQNVHTVEQLSVMDGANLRKLGMKGRIWQQAAVEFLAKAEANRDTMAVAAEKAALHDRIARLEAALAERVVSEAPAPEPVVQDDEPEQEPETVIDDEMSDASGLTKEEIKDEIAKLTGARPRGNPSLKTLEEQLEEARKK